MNIIYSRPEQDSEPQLIIQSRVKSIQLLFDTSHEFLIEFNGEEEDKHSLKLSIELETREFLTGLKECLPDSTFLYLLSQCGPTELEIKKARVYQERITYNSKAFSWQWAQHLHYTLNFMGDNSIGKSRVAINETGIPTLNKNDLEIGGVQGTTEEILSLYELILKRIVNFTEKVILE